MISGIGVPDSR